MPRLSSEATRLVTVATVSISLDPLPSRVLPGDSVVFSGQITQDGVGVGGATAFIWDDSLAVSITEGPTDGNGYYSLPWTVPFQLNDPSGTPQTLPCTTQRFKALTFIPGYAETPLQDVKIAYRTTISGLTAPDRVAPNVPFGIMGTLLFESALGVWSPLGGEPILLMYDNTVIAQVYTESNGLFTGSAVIPTVGMYTIKAFYGGYALGAGPVSVEALSPLLIPVALVALILIA